MSQSIITLAFEQYKAQQEALSQPIELNEFVFAHIPQQDPNVAIDRQEGLPDEELIVFTHAVTQTGYVNDNAVVYSLSMGTEVGDFEFNWMGLRNKASGVIAAISHLPTIVKTKTIIGEQDGNAMTRSIMMNYSNAQRLTGIHVDASTWQIDYTARLFGIDERERLANLDHYGDAAFLTTGFKVVKVGDQYHVTQGQGYVGGLRCSLAADFVMASVLPSSFIYVDASWQGTITSQWQTVFNITASTKQLTDYRDANGVQHYVANIAQIKANGEVIDTRYLGGTPAFERVDNAASDADVDQGLSVNKHIKLPQLWRSLSQLMSGHKNEANPHAQYLLKTEKASLTTNDGYGNANVTFNHRYGVSDIEGSAGRITCATDSPSAQMNFQLADGVAEGQTTSLIDIFLMKLSGVYFKKNIFAPNILEKKYTQFAPWDSTRTYKTGEVCTVEVGGEVLQMQMYAGPNMTCTNKNPADESNRQNKWSNTKAPFWWVPYKSARVGTTLWPWMSQTIPEGTLNVLGNSVPVAVFWRVAQALPEFVNKTTGMIDFPDTRGEFFRVLDQGRNVDTNRLLGSSQGDAIRNITGKIESGHSLGVFNKETPTKGVLSHDGNILYSVAGASSSKSYYSGFNIDASLQVPTANENRPRNLAFLMLMEI